MLLGDAILRISANIADLQSNLAKASQQVTQFKNFVNRGLGMIGVGLSINWFTGFIKQSMAGAESMYDLQQRTGMTAAQLSYLKEAADQGGSSIESFSNILVRLPKQLNAAAQGS